MAFSDSKMPWYDPFRPETALFTLNEKLHQNHPAQVHTKHMGAKKDQELTISYCDTRQRTETRQNSLAEVYKFKCDCLLCLEDPASEEWIQKPAETIAIQFVTDLDQFGKNEKIMGEVLKFLNRELIPKRSNERINLLEYVFDDFLEKKDYENALKYGSYAVIAGDENGYTDVMHGMTGMKLGKLCIYLKKYTKGLKILENAAKVLQHSHSFKDSTVFAEWMELWKEATHHLSAMGIHKKK